MSEKSVCERERECSFAKYLALNLSTLIIVKGFFLLVVHIYEQGYCAWSPHCQQSI